MKKIPRIEELFEGKIIGGSSAGSYVLGRCYWGNDSHMLGDGLGILNIKIFCHYKPADKKNLETLKEFKEDFPILVLPDYKWVVFYK